MRFTRTILVFLSIAVAWPAAAHTNNETIALLKKNKNLECSFWRDSFLNTDKQIAPDVHAVIFKNQKPEASSDSQYATYSLSFQNDDYKFYYFMNSQIGEIVIENKVTGISAQTELDLSDLAKEEAIRKVGEVRITHITPVQVKDPDNGQLIDTTRETRLIGSCRLTK